MGTFRSSQCNSVAQGIWTWAISQNNWVSAAHVPGKLNQKADALSRKYEIHTEWMLNEAKFVEACHFLDFYPTIDLFATRINKQVETFVSYSIDLSQTV